MSSAWDRWWGTSDPPDTADDACSHILCDDFSSGTCVCVACGRVFDVLLFGDLEMRADRVAREPSPKMISC